MRGATHDGHGGFHPGFSGGYRRPVRERFMSSFEEAVAVIVTLVVVGICAAALQRNQND